MFSCSSDFTEESSTDDLIGLLWPFLLNQFRIKQFLPSNNLLKLNTAINLIYLLLIKKLSPVNELPLSLMSLVAAVFNNNNPLQSIASQLKLINESHLWHSPGNAVIVLTRNGNTVSHWYGNTIVRHRYRE